MVLHSEWPNDAGRNQAFQEINVRWGQLHALGSEWSDKAIKFLFITNSGGAIATLSFIGARGERAGLSSFYTLALFLLGVLCVGIVTALAYHDVVYLFNQWRLEARQYLKNELKWEDLHKQDEIRSKDKPVLTAICYASLACWILGCSIGLIGLIRTR